MLRRLRSALGLAFLIVLPSFATAGFAAEAERARTLEVLAAAASRAEAGDLKAWSNDGGDAEIPIGASIVYHFSSERDGHLTVVHVDSHGVMTFLAPSGVWEDRRIGPDASRRFPPGGSGIAITAEPPLGREEIFAFATPAPIEAGDLGLSLASAPVALVEAADAPEVAARLQARLAGFEAGDVAASRIEQRIVARGEGPEYTTGDIVGYFTGERARALERPTLDLHIRFDSGSSELDAEAMRTLDAMGDALLQPQLSGSRFVLGGHTDDVGEEAYNIDLSHRRADSVRAYLIEQHGIGSERLEVEAHGERRPLEPNVSDLGRRMNRRVEVQLAR